MKQNKIIVWILLIILVLGLTFYSLGYRITKESSGSSGNIPAECQPPAGQDLQSWKEHLGHHQETQYCLKYF